MKLTREMQIDVSQCGPIKLSVTLATHTIEAHSVVTQCEQDMVSVLDHARAEVELIVRRFVQGVSPSQIE